MKKLIPFSFILIILTIFYIFIDDYENNLLLSQNLKNCNELDYEEHRNNKVDNFSEIQINLNIEDERKWKKIILNTNISEQQDKSFTYDAKFTNATLRIQNKYGFDCVLKAKIKPHGDLSDHYRDYGPGYDPIYVIPSLKVKLLEGNIFGIVEFRLLIPKTREEGNEIFATTFFQEMGFYAPRTTYANVNYNNKKYKFLFQEKLVKEFLEYNSLQEGLFYAGDERFSFKYENNKKIDGKIIDEKEIGISKFRITESKFIRKNEIFIKPAIETLQVLNVSSHFYTSSIKQSGLIDYYTTQKNTEYENFFKNLPEFDALMYAVGAEHGLSRDDRRFYFDVINKNLIPIYNDGDVKIFSGDKFSGPNYHSDIEEKLRNNIKFTNSARVGAPNIVSKIENIDVKNLEETLNTRGLKVREKDLISILKLIKKNLILLSNLADNQINEVSNLNQHPIKNQEAVRKKIKASYLFTSGSEFQKCDLLLEKCENIKLSSKDLRKALKQDLKDINGDELIFLGDLDKFKKLEIVNKKNNTKKNDDLFITKDFSVKIFGNIDVDIDEENKKIKFLKKNSNSRVLFFNSFLNNWEIEFLDFENTNQKILSRDSNGLSGCINIYDSKIENVKFNVSNAKCEDALNLVRTKGTIDKLNIINSSFDGLDADFSNLSIQNIEVVNSGNDCLDFSYGDYFLNNLNLSKCQDKAVSTGEASKLEINNFLIKDSLIGIASKDSAIVNSTDGSIEKVRNCLSLYKKKQEFNGGMLKYTNLKCEDYQDFVYLDSYSKLIKLN